MKRYENVETTIINKKKVYSGTILPYVEPKDSDIVILTTSTDRLDLLADEYYGDSSMWWVIALKNNLTDIDLVLEPGTILRLPTRTEALPAPLLPAEAPIITVCLKLAELAPASRPMNILCDP